MHRTAIRETVGAGLVTVLGLGVLRPAAAAQVTDPAAILPYWEPGLWKVTTTYETPGAAPTSPDTETRCIDKEEMAKSWGPSVAAGECQTNIEPLGERRAKVTVTCTLAQGARSTGDGVYNWTSWQTTNKGYDSHGKLIALFRRAGARLGGC
ncbi:MAG: DUF3617 domain-containing protein [Vicinamibacteria bacterium]